MNYMEENERKKEKQGAEKKTIYDGIALGERGRDIAVMVLATLLLICFIVAFVTSPK